MAKVQKRQQPERHNQESFGTELRTERNEREREKHFVHWLLVAITAVAASRLCAQTHISWTLSFASVYYRMRKGCARPIVILGPTISCVRVYAVLNNCIHRQLYILSQYLLSHLFHWDRYPKTMCSSIKPFLWNDCTCTCTCKYKTMEYTAKFELHITIWNFHCAKNGTDQ